MVSAKGVAQTSSVPILRGSGLWKGYKNRGRAPFYAVRGVSLDVRAGSTLGLVGETGSGKSTLGRLLLGIVRPSAGTVEFGGQDLTSLRRRGLREFRRSAQMVFQDPYDSLDPRMRVGDSIIEPLLPSGVDRRARGEQLGKVLDRVQLGPEFASRYPHELSGGQRQRVGVARAIITQPRLLVLDEPVSALDVSVQAQILNLLNELQRELGLTYVFISHDLSVIRNVSDQVCVMSGGEIVESGTVDEIYERSQHPYTRGLLAAIPVRHPRDRRRISER